MTDGWTNKRRRDISKFLVKSRKGTVFLKYIDKICKLEDIVEEIGKENVVQIVIGYVANYKAAGELLMREKEKAILDPMCSTLL